MADKTKSSIDTADEKAEKLESPRARRRREREGQPSRREQREFERMSDEDIMTSILGQDPEVLAKQTRLEDFQNTMSNELVSPLPNAPSAGIEQGPLAPDVTPLPQGQQPADLSFLTPQVGPTSDLSVLEKEIEASRQRKAKGKRTLENILGAIGIGLGGASTALGGKSQTADRIASFLADRDLRDVTSPLATSAQALVEPYLDEGAKDLSFQDIQRLDPLITRERLGQRFGTSARKKKLTAEQKKSIGNFGLGLKALTDLQKLVEAGNWKTGLTTGKVVSTPFSFAANRFVEGFARPQTGAAISETEFKNFKNLIPTFTDSDEQAKNKLETMMADFLFKLELNEMPVADVIRMMNKSYGNISKLAGITGGMDVTKIKTDDEGKDVKTLNKDLKKVQNLKGKIAEENKKRGR